MAERLLILSDIWGTQKGRWIASYLGQLRQHYDISFYDIQQLAGIDELIATKENLHKAFVEGGIETAVACLLKKIEKKTHALAFSTGGTIAWKAALRGLPVKSMTLVSATRIRLENQKPECQIDLIYGEKDDFAPTKAWAERLNMEFNLISNFGHELYSDQKIIDEISISLLNKVLKKVV